MTPRLLVANAAPGAAVALDERQSHYLAVVLRLKAGAVLELFDGRGHRFAARLAVCERRGCVADSLLAVTASIESPLVVTLAQCLPAGDKMDWIVEKAVELGVHRIVTLHAQRSAPRGDATRRERRHAHWLRITQAACMQSGRDFLPEVTAPQPLARWLGSAGVHGVRLALVPGAATRLSRVAIAPNTAVAVLVGPESGFSDEERDAMSASGFVPVEMGARVLRTETAGLAALAALQALLGDF